MYFQFELHSVEMHGADQKANRHGMDKIKNKVRQ